MSRDTVRLLGNPVPLLTGLLRKYRVLATVAARRDPVARTPQQLVARASELCEAGLGARSLPEMVLGLWRVEGLVYAFFAGGENQEVSLAELGLPPEAGPPAHCGLAMATVLHEGFSPSRLQQRLPAAADPAFILFSWETLGLMLAMYEPDPFGRLARLLGHLRLLHHRPLPWPEIGSFTAAFPTETQRLLAHGYGRSLYFKVTGLSRALIRASRAPLPAEPCIRGLISAYSLINSRDLGQLLELQLDPLSGQAAVASGIEGGLLNTLKLLAWTRPGCLRDLPVGSERAARLVREAGEQAHADRAAGNGPSLIA